MFEEELEFAQLKGSPKQIIWAEDIREKLAKELLKYVEDFDSDEVENIKEKFATVENAKWWIDRRNSDLDEVLLHNIY